MISKFVFKSFRKINRHSEKSTVNRQMAKNLTVNCQNSLFLTVNRQWDSPIETFILRRLYRRSFIPSWKPYRIDHGFSIAFHR